MREYKIEYWFRRNDEKDFSVETIKAYSFEDAVAGLKLKYEGKIWIFKTKMLPL